MDTKQVIKVQSIGDKVIAQLVTSWHEEGQWLENCDTKYGLLPRSSCKTLYFNSVVEVQNFADEIRAEFIGL